MKKGLLFLLLVFFAGGISDVGWSRGPAASRSRPLGGQASSAVTGRRDAGFTSWMSRPDLDHFLSQFDTVPPGGHPNYWDKGHWIEAVEGRWHEGTAQYRLRYGPVPRPNKGIWWYWYINQPQGTFTQRTNKLGDDGFVLLDPNSCVWPDGTRRYQGVWHKVIPPDVGAAVTSR